jgi:hypothetical protein
MTSSEPPHDEGGEAAPAHGPAARHPGADPWLTWLRKAEHLAVGRTTDLPVPAWLRPTRGEPRWPITLTVLAAIVLQILLPAHLTDLLPRWLMPSLEGALLIGLTVADPVRVERGGTAMRVASIVLILLVTIANAASAVLLIRAIVEGRAGSSAVPLLTTGASVWLTNVIAFGLWYWEFDRGGPVVRAAGAAVRGLPVSVIHECDGVQPDGRHAARPLGQAHDAGPVGRVAGHRRPGDRQGCQHPADLTGPAPLGAEGDRDRRPARLQ